MRIDRTASDQLRAMAVLLLVAAAAMSASFAVGPPATDSECYNILWTSEFAKGFARGEIYPRWLPSSFEALGSPTFYFYPPLAFFLSGGLRALGVSLNQSINGAAFVAMLASGVSMYAWLRPRSRWPVLAAALYMIAPYHLYDLYVRADLAEYSSFAWLPLIALSIENLPRPQAVLALAISWAGLIVTHIPTALIASLLLILPFATLRVYRDPKVLLSGFTAALFGAGLAAIYLVPALTLQRYVNMDVMWSGVYRPSQWYIWNWLRPPVSLSWGRRYFLVLPLDAIVGILISVRSRSLWTGLTIFIALAAFGLVPFWDLQPFEKVQFPWRALAILDFTALTAFAMSPPRRLIAVAAAGLALQAYVICGREVSAAVSRTAREVSPWYRDILASGSDAREYLPRGLPVTATGPMPNFAAYRDLPRPAAAIVVRAVGPVTLRLSAFPIWRISKDGVDAPTRGPLLTFDGSPGVYRLRRVPTPEERIGGLASLLAICAMAAFAATRVRGERRRSMVAP